MMKRIVKYVILLSIVLGSSLSLLIHAESTDVTSLKEQIVTEQKEIESSIAQLYEGSNQPTFSLKNTSLKVKQLLEDLDKVIAKTEKLNKLDQEAYLPINEENQKMLDKLEDNQELLQVTLALENLFKENVFEENKFNEKIELKSDVTKKTLENLKVAVQELNQPNQVKEQCIQVIDSAEEQLQLKEQLKQWYQENSEIITNENYQKFQELVDQIVPGTTKKEYEQKLADYKEKLNYQATNEVNETDNRSQQKTNPKKQKEEIKVVSKLESNFSDTTETTQETTQSSDQTIQEPVAIPEERTDGFNFKGYHFDLSSFSGTGSVPTWTPYVYQWTEDPTHYLFERASSAGTAVWEINIGDQVVINGQTYTVFNIMRNVPNNDQAYGVLKSQGAAVTWQTCEESNSNSSLAIWFAN